ncbi:hypothetical protein GCM10007301_29310 [Azorhizobium oxalatiphilum]|uniref:DUF4334 domain-containing protein n=1 Tax=Azorhizobium oxalatiphilum TaxID=980631 RepID=A0A917C1U9_9HYPH|nr:hypothetical protein GCM10007301_29310 [Azorhizobium oxalatiphilum]
MPPDGAASRDALAYFDTLPPVSVSDMGGLWRGRELPTGHPLDGILEPAGWFGKRFSDAETVDPLLFGTPDQLVAVNPALVPIGILLRAPFLARNPVALAVFRSLRTFMATSAPKARLRTVRYRGSESAAMIYDDLPIIDHFRRSPDQSVIGAMDLRGTDAPFMFQLTAVAKESERV